MSHGGAREKDRYQGARWARREQKLSGKRRINSRHAAASQAYAPQAGTTSTQLGGERRESGVDPQQGDGRSAAADCCPAGTRGQLPLRTMEQSVWAGSGRGS